MPPAAMDAGGPPVHSVHPPMRAMSLVIPGALTLVAAYVLYAVPGHVLMDQLYRVDGSRGLALGLLVPYVVLAALMVASYLRTLATVRLCPGVVPLGPAAARDYGASAGEAARAAADAEPTARSCSPSKGNAAAAAPPGADRRRQKLCGLPLLAPADTPQPYYGTDLEAGGRRGRGGGGGRPYGTQDRSALRDHVNAGARARTRHQQQQQQQQQQQGPPAQPTTGDPRLDPDSPGLELFYTKDVFECAADGRPVWCTPCGTWKPDRAHHCSEIRRCVRKMDHFCPWVGGVVSETAFKFFVQFTCYATLVCALTVAISGYALWRRRRDGAGLDARTLAALVLGAVLGAFAFSMALSCVHFALTNTTSVEAQQLKTRRKLMAVRIRRGTPPDPARYRVVTYPLPRDEPPAYEVAAAQPAQPLQPPTPRDQLAFRTFAVLPVPAGLNVWDLGWRRNWSAVMGAHVLDWLLPLRRSPCCDHDSMHSFYAVSPAFKAFVDTFRLPPCNTATELPPDW